MGPAREERYEEYGKIVRKWGKQKDITSSITVRRKLTSEGAPLGAREGLSDGLAEGLADGLKEGLADGLSDGDAEVISDGVGVALPALEGWDVGVVAR